MLQLFNIKKSSEKLSEVIFTPWENNTQEALTAIIVHYSLVIVALSHDKLLAPFVTILTQTAKSKVGYIYNLYSLYLYFVLGDVLANNVW